MNNALVVYYSKTGNTEKVAAAIGKGLERSGLAVTVKRLSEADVEEFHDYDIVCLGSPILHSLPPPPVMEFIKKRDEVYRTNGVVHVPSAKLANKRALVFCTYSGPHCGMNEALPTGKYLRQFFEHIGFEVMDEWYEVGEFHGWESGSTQGKMGDIRGRPDADDLALIELKAVQLVKEL